MEVRLACNASAEDDPCFRMGRWWQDQEAWKEGLEQSAPACSNLTKILSSACTEEAGQQLCRSLSKAEAQWFADSVVLFFNTIHAFVLWGWLVPLGLRRERKPKSAGQLDRGEDWSRQLSRAIKNGEAHSSVLQHCFKLMNPLQQRPSSSLLVDGRPLSERESHDEWCAQVVQQTIWKNEYDLDYHNITERRISTLAGQAWTHRGEGLHDSQVAYDEVLARIKAWDQTYATTPDLLPRIVFKIAPKEWVRMVWLTMRLTGPGCLAIRPLLCRGSAAVPLHKKGDCSNNKSFRLIMVKCQLGLLQEGIVFARTSVQVRSSITPGQSGYMRDVADAHLLLHELVAERCALLLCLWAYFGDLEKAFPRTWRCSLLQQLHDKAGLRDGMFGLLSSILEQDRVHVNISGNTVLLVVEGVAEGGLIGPLAFPSYMEGLTELLVSNGCGVGLGVQIPSQWGSHVWRGSGAPDPVVAKAILACLRDGGPLPPQEDLAQSPTLEASALKALDDHAPMKLAAVLHADDPVLLSSSFGGATLIQELMAQWAWKHKAHPHTGIGKSVVMVCGPADASLAASSLPPLVMCPRGRPRVPIALVSEHKWLGLAWTDSLGLRVIMEARIKAAAGKFSLLLGMVVGGTLPLSLALVLFEACVDGALRFGRWLFGAEQDLHGRLDMQLQSWGKSLLGASPWRSWGTTFGELGWRMSGSGRAVVDVAMRRARLWNLASDDLYRRVFVAAHSSPGRSWAKKSAGVLGKWGIIDWQVWRSEGTSLDHYKDYVKEQVERVCLASWSHQVSTHLIPIPYLERRELPTADLHPRRTCGLSWSTLISQRSACRLRAGLVRLGHLHGSRSGARKQLCIYCDTLNSSLHFHVLARCPVWATSREGVWMVIGDKPELMAQQVHTLFSLAPGDIGYTQWVEWSAALDTGARCFWGGEQDFA